MFQMTTEAEAYARTLEKMSDVALPRATARTLTALASGANEDQKKNVQAKMIVRTPYTVKSMKFYKASETKKISRQNSVVGSVSPYLAIHDDGGTIKAKKNKVPIPTNKVRGADRKKKVPARWRVSSMQPIGKNTQFFVLYPTKADHKEMSSYGVGIVRATGKRKLIYGRRRGKKTVAYRLTRPAIFTRYNGKLIKLRDLSLKSYDVQAVRWHVDAIFKYSKFRMINDHFISEAKKIFGDFKEFKSYKGLYTQKGGQVYGSGK